MALNKAQLELELARIALTSLSSTLYNTKKMQNRTQWFMRMVKWLQSLSFLSLRNKLLWVLSCDINMLAGCGVKGCEGVAMKWLTGWLCKHKHTFLAVTQFSRGVFLSHVILFSLNYRLFGCFNHILHSFQLICVIFF